MWILECFEIHNINRTLRGFIKNSMGLWKTTLEANSKPNAQVIIKCGAHQGDLVSPLLFCISLMSAETFEKKWQPSVTSCVVVLQQPHRIVIRLDKFGWMESKREKIIRTEGVEQCHSCSGQQQICWVNS